MKSLANNNTKNYLIHIFRQDNFINDAKKAKRKLMMRLTAGTKVQLPDHMTKHLKATSSELRVLKDKGQIILRRRKREGSDSDMESGGFILKRTF